MKSCAAILAIWPAAPVAQNTSATNPQTVNEIADQVSRAISNDGSVGGTVRVKVKHNEMVLSGFVHDQTARERAQQIATSYATNSNLTLSNRIETAADYFVPRQPLAQRGPLGH